MSGPPIYPFMKKVQAVADNSFKMTVSMSALETMVIPATGTNDFIIDWGDGSATEHITTSSPSHEYVDADSYQISIDGSMTSFAFNNAGNKLNITSLDQWGDMGLTNLVGGFRGCMNMSSIPNAPITGADAIVSCLNLFANTTLPSIPSGLFDNVTLVTTFEKTFQSSTGFTSIPSGLFDNNTLVLSFLDTFSSTNITSIPSGLFANNTLVTTFRTTFRSANMTSIPSGLFDNNTLVTSFRETFRLSNLTSIVAGLFDNNTAVLDFIQTFDDCPLNSIPENLFVNNINVTNYSGVFRNIDGGVTLPSVIFTLSSLNIVTVFNNAFNARSPGFSGTAQDIWNFALSAASANTYLNQTNISNYADIPNDWKGL